jgi:transcriptional regulator with XRE-family HTH domain
MPDSADDRRRSIGLLIRRARERAGRTRKECAEFAGLSPLLLRKIEEGLHEPSLVELEAIAHYLRIPVLALLDEGESAHPSTPRIDFNFFEVARLRTHIVGARLKQARLKSKQSVKQLAESLGMAPALLNAYELGKRPIPITRLEQLAVCLNIPLESLLDIGIGPLGRAQLQHKQHAYFDCLPEAVRAFITDPNALPYLRLAMRLSRLPTEELRNAGQALFQLSQSSPADDATE